RPGSPSRMANLPWARRSSQSQSTGRDVNSLRGFKSMKDLRTGSQAREAAPKPTAETPRGGVDLCSVLPNLWGLFTEQNARGGSPLLKIWQFGSELLQVRLRKEVALTWSLPNGLKKVAVWQ